MREIIKQAIGVQNTDVDILALMMRSKEEFFSIMELANELGLHRTTIQKRVKVLLSEKVIQVRQVNLKRGFKLVYGLIDIDSIYEGLIRFETKRHNETISKIKKFRYSEKIEK